VVLKMCTTVKPPKARFLGTKIGKEKIQLLKTGFVYTKSFYQYIRCKTIRKPIES
jgi:hypothetical protein